ncbi:Derlin-1 [Tritrichomonas foetus]|uniref:Derlin n=1 Tax=Tritrichomonas foetus TaxID=1144522 RepID=A0A1J4JAG7_9EUKA|nr:Derlin-1 [Tritrichomonas foetus]|eukprot:OHS94635.1 Derlin-1 [Tritrichomonas foetus]
MMESLDKAPVTKCLLCICIVLSLLVSLGILYPFDLFFSMKMIRKYHQIWRILTSFFYFGDFSAGMVFQLISFVQYSSTVEKGLFSGQPIDYIIFLVFGMTMITTISEWFFTPLFFDIHLISYLTYYWSKHYGDQIVRLSIIPFPVKVQYLPIAVLVLRYNDNGMKVIVPSLLGYAISHIYFFVHDVINTKFHKNFFRAPECILKPNSMNKEV